MTCSHVLSLVITKLCVLKHKCVWLFAGIDKLVYALRYLKDFPCADWYRLGLELGLHKNNLDTIEANYHHRNQDCFREMLAAWLSRKDQVPSSGDPTWKQLIEALEQLGHASIALTIKQSLAKSKSVGVVPQRDWPSDHNYWIQFHRCYTRNVCTCVHVQWSIIVLSKNGWVDTLLWYLDYVYTTLSGLNY